MVGFDMRVLWFGGCLDVFFDGFLEEPWLARATEGV
jgi:hypothetical protein